jgi:hypothetical protein
MRHYRPPRIPRLARLHDSLHGSIELAMSPVAGPKAKPHSNCDKVRVVSS